MMDSLARVHLWAVAGAAVRSLIRARDNKRRQVRVHFYPQKWMGTLFCFLMAYATILYFQVFIANKSYSRTDSRFHESRNDLVGDIPSKFCVSSYEGIVIMIS